MTINNEHVAALIQTILDAQRRHVAVGLANALKAVKSAAGLSAADRFDSISAEAAWVAAKAALTHYRAIHF